MPTADVSLKNFFSDNEVFADLFNAVAFQGQQIIKPDELQTEDTTYGVSVDSNEGTEKIGRYRDVVRKSAMGASFVIMGVENQQHIHYAMPVRTMLYDALSYIMECRNIAQTQERSGWTVDEFLSKMSKGTKLTPVFTIVLYYGEDPWDAPTSLYEMLDIDERIRPFISDYHMNFIDVGNSKGKLPFKSEKLRQLFDFLQYIYHRKEETAEEKISGEIVSLVGIITDSKSLYESGKESDLIMCNAIEKIEREGELKVLYELVKDGSITMERAAQAAGLELEQFKKEMHEKSAVLV